MTIGEFFGTLQESVTAEWRKHLQTNKYSEHMALNDFYEDMPEKIDALIEAWQADNDIVEDYKNILDEEMSALEYVEALKLHVIEGRKEYFSGKTELESLTDDILSLIDSTIYKLKHLKESKDNACSLSDFLKEALNERILDKNPTAQMDAEFELWNKIVGLVQKAVDKGSLQASNSLWKYSDEPDYDQIESIIKKIKPKKLTKSDSLEDKSFIGLQQMDGKFNNMIFYDGKERDKIRPHQQSSTTSGIIIGYAFAKEADTTAYAAWEWLRTRSVPGIKRVAYECPSQVVQQIYDIVKSKY